MNDYDDLMDSTNKISDGDEKKVNGSQEPLSVAFQKSEHEQPEIQTERNTIDQPIPEDIPESLTWEQKEQQENERRELIKEIRRAHEKNQLVDNQIQKSKDFMENVMFKVPLHELYKVVASCNYNEENYFCPVLVQIIDEKILEENMENNVHYPYLLQVWTKKGEMVFERKLRQPISNWNMCDDKLIFQEKHDTTKVFIVKLFKEDMTPKIFQFKFPKSAVKQRVNTRWNDTSKQFVIPPESEKDGNSFDLQIEAFQNDDSSSIDMSAKSDSSNDQDDVDRDMRKMFAKGEFNTNYSSHKIVPVVKSAPGQPGGAQATKSQRLIDNGKSLNSIFKDSLIDRSPDKMIDILDNMILLAYRNSIIYVNVKKYGVNDFSKCPQEFKQSEDHAIVPLKQEQLSFLKLDDKFKIITIQEIGNACTAVVLEDIRTRQIRYLRAEYQESGQDDSTRRLTLVQLGIKVNAGEFSRSELVKYRSVAKVDPRTGKNYQVGIVVRASGRFEVYSDFMLIYEFYSSKNQCVDVETDFNSFFLKFVKNCDAYDENTELKDLETEVRQIRHIWRNRISMHTASEAKKTSTCWTNALHQRIAGYFKLYTQIMNFSMFMLVAHRNMISVYDMTKKKKQQAADGSAMSNKEVYGSKVSNKNVSMMLSNYSLGDHSKDTDEVGEWIDTVIFEKGMIREMFVKKCPKVKAKIKRAAAEDDNIEMMVESIFTDYNVIIMMGTHSIEVHKLSSSGKLQQDKEQSIDTDGRIIRFQNDESYKTGMLMLTDDTSAKSPEYKDALGSKLYTYPHTPNPDPEAKVFLSCMKSGKIHELLNSKDSKALDHDSFFRVIQANHAVFQDHNAQLQKGGSLDEEEIAKAFDEKAYVKVVVLTSIAHRRSEMHAIDNEKDENGNIKLKKENFKLIEFDETEDDDPPIHSFYVTSDEFGEQVDSYIQISQKQIKVYDRNLQEKWTYAGLNIRYVFDIHQGYLYTISDSIATGFYVTEEEAEEGPLKKKQGEHASSGFYVFDIDKLLQGEISKYKLGGSMGGVCSSLDNSKFSDRVSYIQNYDFISIVPFPHLNLINCIGMGQKHEYLMWREKNGFFTALDKKGKLLTWSLISGKLLYNEDQTEDAKIDKLQQYEVYRADNEDISYTQNLYCFNKCSLQLLKNKLPMGKATIDLDEINQKNIDSKLAKQEKKNKAGLINADTRVKQLPKDLFRPAPANVSIDISNSQQNADLFHFKVMELKTYEDHYEDSKEAPKGSSCRLLFHFMFPLIRKQDNEKLANFDWDVDSTPQQRLYLSRNTEKLLVVTNNFIGQVYTRFDVDPMGTTIRDLGWGRHQESTSEAPQGQLKAEKQVTWKHPITISRFPSDLASGSSVPHLFSPNFKYQLDFHYRHNEILIKETATQNIYFKFPKDLFRNEFHNLTGSSAIKIIVSRFKWLTENTFQFINESNLDCIFEIYETGNRGIKDRHIKLLSAVKIDNLFTNINKRDSNHLMLDPKVLPSRDLLERLMRKNQAYKSSVQHAINLGIERGDSKFNLLQQLNTIDYSQTWGDKSSFFDIETSFTWLDMKIMEMILKDKDFKVSEIDTEQAVQLCFNIWPSGRGIFHMLALGTLSSDPQAAIDEGNQIEAYWSATELFNICNEKHDFGITGQDEEGNSFEIPILPDMYGSNPLEMTLAIYKQRAEDQKVFFHNADVKEIIKKTENIAMAEVIIDNISEYGLMHSSHFINEAIIKATRLGLEPMSDYFDSRLQKVSHCFDSTTQLPILDSVKKESPTFGTYGSITTPIWHNEGLIRNQMFSKTGKLQPMDLQYIDVPNIHKNTPVGKDFIYGLAECENLELFKNGVVQILIDNHWKYWVRYSLWSYGLPLIIQLAVFWYWSNIVLVNLAKDKDTFEGQNNICIFVIVLLVIYFLLYDLPSIYKNHFRYFLTLNNFVTIALAVTLLVNCFADHENFTVTFWTVQTWTALLIWGKLLLYLRTFPKFSWIIRMIQACFKDIKYFMVVLIIGIFAFADAFLSIEQVILITKGGEAESEKAGLRLLNDDMSEFEANYHSYMRSYVIAWQNSFLTALGDFGDELGDYREGDWLIFFFCAIFNIILLLNLLIAIISETFTQYKDSSVPKSYQEKVQQMTVMQDSWLGLYAAMPDPKEFIFVAKVVNSQELNQDDYGNQIEELHAKIDRMDEMMQLTVEKIDLLGKSIDQRSGNGSGEEIKNQSIREIAQKNQMMASLARNANARAQKAMDGIGVEKQDEPETKRTRQNLQARAKKSTHQSGGHKVPAKTKFVQGR